MSYLFGDAEWAQGLGLASPEVQKALLEVEARYGPQYIQNTLARQEAGLFGSDGQPGLIDIAGRAAPEIQGIVTQAQTRQREADISDVEALGARATQAFRESDPDRLRLLNQQRGVVDDLFARAAGVTPQQSRMAEQGAREAYGARGRDLDNASIFAEALGREEFMRANRAEALGAAQGLFGQYQMSSADPFQAILGRPGQQYNQAFATGQQALGLQSGPALFNPDAGVNLALQQQANMANYNASIYGAQAAQGGGLGVGQGALAGASTGAAFGPWGALVGGVVGAGAGLLF